MSRNIKCVDIYKKVKLAQNLLSDDLLPEKASLNEEIYENVEDLSPRRSPDEMKQVIPTTEEMTPSEYLGLLENPMNMHGYDLGLNAYDLYNQLYGGAEKYSNEKVAELINEIVKIGKAKYVIKEIMAKQEGNEKIASEMIAINSAHLSEILNELLH